MHGGALQLKRSIAMGREIVLTVVAIVLGVSTPAAQSAVRADIQQFVRAYVDAHNNADATATMGMMSRKSGVSSVTMGKISRGWDAIRSDVDEAVGSADHPKMVLGVIDVESLSPSYALVVAPFGANVSTPQGDVQVRGALTLLLEKSGGKWKVLHDHTSIQLPQAVEGD